MISRLAGILESIDGLDALIRADGGVWYAVLIPAYEAERLRGRIGSGITLQTIHYLESQGQGSSYIPRLIGFSSAADRRFFELLTTVDGLGNRKALRAMAQEPAHIARAILGADAAWLATLPEIGKKTAEKVILELKTKVGPFLTVEEVRGLDAAAGGVGRPPAGPASAAEEAIAALIALGESRADADRLVRTALARAGGRGLKTADQILAAAVGG
jgi:Holliday junction DNA helicase RuvA